MLVGDEQGKVWLSEPDFIAAADMTAATPILARWYLEVNIATPRRLWSLRSRRGRLGHVGRALSYGHPCDPPHSDLL